MIVQLSKNAEQRRAKESFLTSDYVRSILAYTPEDGTFRWRSPRPKVRVGSIAGNTRPDGYKQIRIDGRIYLAHRLAWLWVTGSFPADGQEIDHKNQLQGDNRFANLRESSHSQNMAHARLRSDNLSGMRGVHRHGAKLAAQITVAGKQCYLGVFANKYSAARAYDRAAIELHGEFAVLNNLPHPQFRFDELMASVEFLSARKCSR
jgi:hypothetical protein